MLKRYHNKHLCMYSSCISTFEILFQNFLQTYFCVDHTSSAFIPPIFHFSPHFHFFWCSTQFHVYFLIIYPYIILRDYTKSKSQKRISIFFWGWLNSLRCICFLFKGLFMFLCVCMWVPKDNSRGHQIPWSCGDSTQHGCWKPKSVLSKSK